MSRDVLATVCRAIALCAALAACGQDADPNLMLGYGEARYVYVAAQDGGRIAQVLAQEGDAVEAGAVLFRLDPERLAMSAAAARADAQAAQERARRAGALAQAVAEARAQARLAATDHERSRALFERGHVARARLEADRARLEAATATLARAEAELQAARAQTGALDKTAALAERRVSDLDVPAPSAGIVDQVYRRPGEVVAAGEPLAALITPEAMRVRFFAKQEVLARLAPGTEVALACDGCAEGLTGRVTYVAHEPQFTPPVIYSRQERSKLVFLVEAAPKDSSAIRPGLPVEVRLLGGETP